MRWMLLMALLLIGCEGPVGPEGSDGEPGPGTRTILSGDLPPDFSFARVPLPPGLSLEEPPALSCFGVEGSTLLQASACHIESHNGVLVARVHPPANVRSYRIVVVY